MGPAVKGSVGRLAMLPLRHETNFCLTDMVTTRYIVSPRRTWSLACPGPTVL